MKPTPPPRKPKRYTSRLEIMLDIHKAQRQRLRASQKADVALERLSELKGGETPTGPSEIRNLSIDADQFIKQSMRLDIRINKLSDTMSCFITKTLPLGDFTDGSVTLQKI